MLREGDDAALCLLLEGVLAYSFRMHSDILPQTLLIDRRVKDSALVERMLSRLPDSIKVIEVSERGDPITQLGMDFPSISQSTPGSATAPAHPADNFRQGKRVLLLTRYDGEWLKPCPGTDGHVCCNLWIVNPGEGCPMDCTYCYLQSYLLRNPTLKLYTNTDEMLQTLGERAKKEPSRLFRVGTGEVIDSLVWDELSDLSLEMVPFFGEHENLLLELKTKSASIKNLLSMDAQIHKGKTVVSWSVNAESVTQKDEANTADLSSRIKAAEQVVNAGYRVGFHFDPLVRFPGWEDEYRDTIERIFSKIPADRIAWVSLSSLRYQPEMQEIMMRRFPDSSLPFGEQFLASDQKLRYVQPVRFQMLNFVRDVLKAKCAELPVYMCMESAAAWRNIAGGAPVAGSELREVFSRRGHLTILPNV